MSARRVRRDPRRRWRRLAAFTAAFVTGVLAVFAWSVFTAEPDDSESATTPDSTTSTIPEPSGPRVLDPGAEPRQVLRLDFTEGEQIMFRTVTDLDVAQTAGDEVTTVDTPGVIQTMTMTVDRVHTGGSQADISFEITGASVFPEDRFSQQTLDELDLSLAALVGVGGSGRITDSGEVISFDYRYDGDDELVLRSLDQLEGQAELLTPSLPTEPLGVGARWEVETAARLAGITFSQVTTYELTGITDGSVEFSSTVSQTAAPQDLDLPGADEARLVSFAGSGSGSGQITLASLVASGTTSVTGTQTIVLTPSGGSEIELTQDLVLELVVDVIW